MGKHTRTERVQLRDAAGEIGEEDSMREKPLSM